MKIGKNLNFMDEYENKLRRFNSKCMIVDNREGEDYGGEENEEDIEKLCLQFSGDRKNHPYIFDEKDLDKPIKRYCSSYTLRKELIGSSSSNKNRSIRYELKNLYERFERKYEQQGDKKKKPFFQFTEGYTHTIIGGGSLGIPADEEDNFLELYAKCIVAGLGSWIIEKNTKVTRLCFDFDIWQKNSWPFHRIEMLAYVIQDQLKKFFPELDSNNEEIKQKTYESLHCIVSTAKPVPKLIDNIEMLKTGVHMHWGIYTDEERSLIIRESLIYACTKQIGKRILPLNPWDKVIDDSIFNPNGMCLRLMGAEKTIKCPKCEKLLPKERNFDCMECFGEKAINKGRPYMALFVMDIYGNRVFAKEKEYKKDYLQLVKDTKIRTSFDEIPSFPKFVIPEGAPLPNPDEKRGSKKKKPKISQPNLDGKQEKEKQIRGDTIEITNGDIEWDAIEEFINKHSLPIYKNIIVSEIKTSLNRNFYTVHVKGEYSRYCHNISREHSNNRIYFYICSEGMVQRCHDNQEDPEMKFGICSKYSSATIPLTYSLQQLLFKKNDLKAPQEIIETTDKKLKMLLVMGNELCKNVFNSNWTLEDENGELLISKNLQSKKFKKDILLDSMEETFTSTYTFSKSKGDEMGTKSSEILQMLGFIETPQKKRKYSINSDEEEDETIYNLENQAFKNLFLGVQIACMMTKKEVLNFTFT